MNPCVRDAALVEQARLMGLRNFDAGPRWRRGLHIVSHFLGHSPYKVLFLIRRADKSKQCLDLY